MTAQEVRRIVSATLEKPGVSEVLNGSAEGSLRDEGRAALKHAEEAITPYVIGETDDDTITRLRTLAWTELVCGEIWGNFWRIGQLFRSAPIHDVCNALIAALEETDAGAATIRPALGHFERILTHLIEPEIDMLMSSPAEGRTRLSIFNWDERPSLRGWALLEILCSHPQRSSLPGNGTLPSFTVLEVAQRQGNLGLAGASYIRAIERLEWKYWDWFEYQDEIRRIPEPEFQSILEGCVEAARKTPGDQRAAWLFHALTATRPFPSKLTIDDALALCCELTEIECEKAGVAPGPFDTFLEDIKKIVPEDDTASFSTWIDTNLRFGRREVAYISLLLHAVLMARDVAPSWRRQALSIDPAALGRVLHLEFWTQWRRPQFGRTCMLDYYKRLPEPMQRLWPDGRRTALDVLVLLCRAVPDTLSWTKHTALSDEDPGMRRTYRDTLRVAGARLDCPEWAQDEEEAARQTAAEAARHQEAGRAFVNRVIDLEAHRLRFPYTHPGGGFPSCSFRAWKIGQFPSCDQTEVVVGRVKQDGTNLEGDLSCPKCGRQWSFQLRLGELCLSWETTDLTIRQCKECGADLGVFQWMHDRGTDGLQSWGGKCELCGRGKEYSNWT